MTATMTAATRPAKKREAEPEPPAPIPLHILFLLDRSGSMTQIRGDVIGGFNAFLAEQQADQLGKVRLTLVQFDQQGPFEIVHEAKRIEKVPPLTEATFVPRGSTPLLDAEGRAMVWLEEREARRRAEGKREEQVIFATYTDGLENVSREWSFEQVAAKKAEHEGRWVFLYLGVGHDGYGQAARVGTMVVNTTSAPKGPAGAAMAYNDFRGEVRHTRSRAAQGVPTASFETRAATEAEAAELIEMAEADSEKL